MEICEEDNTAVLRMKRDYKSFLTDKNTTSGSSRSNLLEDTFGQRMGTSSTSASGSSISVQQIIEKDRHEQERKTEMIRLRTRNKELESQVEGLKSHNRKFQVEMEQKMESLRQEAEAEHQQMKQMRHQMAMVNRREQETKNNMAQAKQDFAAIKQKLEQKLNTKQAEMLELENRAAEVESSLKDTIKDQKKAILWKDTELQMAQTDLQETTEQLKVFKRKYAETQELKKQLEESTMEAYESKVKLQALEQKFESSEGDSLVVQSSKEKLARYAELEQQNKKLMERVAYYKDMQENVSVQREKCEDMRRKLERSEERLADRAALQVKCQQLQEQLDQWSATDNTGKRRPMSPHRITARNQELQTTNAILLEKQGRLQASVTSLENSLDNKSKKIEVLTEKITKDQDKLAQYADFVKRAQRKIILIQKERDAYKNIIETYESEVTLNMSGRGGAGAAAGIADVLGGDSRVHKLEDMLESHRQQAAQQDQELEARAQLISTLRGSITTLKEELVLMKERASQPTSSTHADKQMLLQLRQQVADLEKHLEKTEEEKIVLECRLEKRHLQGDYDPTRTKVIHLLQNPISETLENKADEVARLKEDNKRLTQRLELIEASGPEGIPEDLTVQVGERILQPTTREDVEKAKKEMELAEIRNKRLTEQYQTFVHNFREAVQDILGYKIEHDSNNPNIFKLTSKYAESPSDYLNLKKDEDGVFKLLNSDFASQPDMEEKIRVYLQECSSFPAFLAAITMELHSRTTMGLIVGMGQ